MSNIIDTKVSIYEAYENGYITESEKDDLLYITNLHDYYSTESIYYDIFNEYASGNLDIEDVLEIITEEESNNDEEDDEKKIKKEKIKNRLKTAAKVAVGTGIVAGTSYGIYKHADKYNNKQIDNYSDKIRKLNDRKSDIINKANEKRKEVESFYNKKITNLNADNSSKVKEIDDKIKAFTKECNEKRKKLEKLDGRRDPRTGKKFNADARKAKLNKDYHNGITKLKEERDKIANAYTKHNLDKISKDRIAANHDIDKLIEDDLNKIENSINKYIKAREGLVKASPIDKVKNVASHDKEQAKSKLDMIYKTIKGAGKVVKTTTAPLRKIAEADKGKS